MVNVPYFPVACPRYDRNVTNKEKEEVKAMTDKKRKIGMGLYEFKGFTIRKNVLKEYGYPQSAWIITNPKGEEEGPSWTLKGAIQWVREILK